MVDPRRSGFWICQLQRHWANRKLGLVYSVYGVWFGVAVAELGGKSNGGDSLLQLEDKPSAKLPLSNRAHTQV